MPNVPSGALWDVCSEIVLGTWFIPRFVPEVLGLSKECILISMIACRSRGS